VICTLIVSAFRLGIWVIDKIFPFLQYFSTSAKVNSSGENTESISDI